MAGSNTVMMSLDRYDELMRRLHRAESLVDIEVPYSGSSSLHAVINRSVFMQLAVDAFNRSEFVNTHTLLDLGDWYVPSEVIVGNLNKSTDEVE